MPLYLPHYQTEPENDGSRNASETLTLLKNFHFTASEPQNTIPSLHLV